MKKVLSILLAVLMLGSMFAFAGSAADDAYTLADILAIAQTYDDANTKHIVLVLDYAAGKPGSVYQGQIYKISTGTNAGCYALVDEAFVAGNYVQLPSIMDASEGMQANWMCMTANAGQGTTYAAGSLYQIPVSDAFTGNYIMFRSVETANEQTSTISKIVEIFARVIKVLLGEEVAQKFLSIFAEILG